MNIKFVKTVIESIMVGLDEVVEAIEENSLNSTMDNYGDYYVILSGIKGNAMQFLTAIALIRCGAPENGVIEGLKLCNQEWGNKLALMVEEKRVMQ